MTAREPRRAGDEHYHRSATTVTGDPNTRKQAESLRQRPGAAPRIGGIQSPCERQSAARTADARHESRKPAFSSARATVASLNTRYGSVRAPKRCIRRRPIDCSSATLRADG